VRFRKVTKAGVFEVVRSLRIVAAPVTRIICAGFQSVVITLTVSAHTVTKHVLAVIPVRIPITIAIPVRAWIAKPRSNKNPCMAAAAAEPTAKSSLCVRVSVRQRRHTKHEQRSQHQISNPPQQVFSFHDMPPFSPSSLELNYA